ncbi:AT-hook motif nuclear-localized protein 6 [Andrographis paniculata]|uniref:AT-hook motif nuclear-localized protein 6 n=1 Tax=Andrographis paniculata TaxID=175694 RepID=UPI0021E92528|nr:AT-hook motif nuclear-localized protein 6 [Andrographis paniculata]
MEEKEGINGAGITVKGEEAPPSFRVEPRVENSSQFGGSTAPPVTPAAQTSGDVRTSEMKKKRGRPRKYATDGAIVALSPMPISASIPFTGDYSWKQGAARSADSSKKKHKLDFGSAGQMSAYPTGGNFTPHMITINSGEDIMMKIISFSQQGSRAICILAANGTISNVTLRQPNSSGGTLTYEGRFEILSLTGSFMPSDNGQTKSRSGGMSVSLAGPDGRVLGGGLAGMLVAAGPVQVVIGSFVTSQQQPEPKPKKPKYEHTITFAPIPSNPLSEERYEPTSSTPKPNLTTPATFHEDNLASVNTTLGPKIADVENNILLPDEDPRDQGRGLTC